jgi:hypothetical protein
MKTAGSIRKAFPNPAVAARRDSTRIHVALIDFLLKITGWRCWCKTTTRVFMDHEGYYTRCLDCGRRLPYCGKLVGGLSLLEARFGQSAD